MTEIKCQPIRPLFKGYHHPIKTAYKKGLLPTVQRGLSGEKLTLENVSLEHMDCFSKTHDNSLSNVALETKTRNSKKGDRPIEEVLTKRRLKKYLAQFEGIKNKYLDGPAYIKAVWDRFADRLKY